MRALLLTLGVLANCVFAGTTSPADNFGELFVQVQLQKIFPDGKTFVDAQPKAAPTIIMQDYARAKPATKIELQEFVRSHFELPAANATATNSNEHLPLLAHINALWSLLQRAPGDEIENSSALALPHTYIVPGGRFREVYYWDSYFTLLGVAADGHKDLVDAMLNNFTSLIERYGHIPNGTRSYYLSRSQPPFFALMLNLTQTHTRAQLDALIAEHRYWMAGKNCVDVKTIACARVVRMTDGSLLNRYWDDRDTPRDESYAEDVATAGHVKHKAETYRHLRAAAESGWDFSSRWLRDKNDLSSIHTTDIVPVDLNSLLWFQEKQIATLCQEFRDIDCATNYQQLSASRASAIHKYLWLSAQRRFADFDTKTQSRTQTLSAATLYPLFVGLATQAQAKAVARTTRQHLLAQGGLRTTQIASGQQWDKPNGWAPLQWIAVTGLRNYGEDALAKAIAARWITTVNIAYKDTGKLLEKYDVEERRPGGGGEYPLQDGFGWTNGVVRALVDVYPELNPDKQ